jgi:hypothetical protein
MRDSETISVPWPARSGVAFLKLGDRVVLNHISRREWMIDATVVAMTSPGRAVEVKPDEPITSPANWEIIA